MTTDPDILAIRRRRRQEGRCVACGGKAPRAALCKACRATLAYCPKCGALYPRRPGLPMNRSSDYCKPCLTLHTRIRRGGRDRVTYLADITARQDRLLPEIIRRYRAGQGMTEAADQLGLTRKQIDLLITHARARGSWPAGLRRYRRKKV